VARQQIPELSKAEWLIMNQCWRRGRCTARQIFDEALARRSWSYQTVKTMLDRLAVKGYLKREKLGPLCLYEPAVARTSVVSKSIEAFWETVLGKNLAPLFAHLADEKLSEDEIVSLKKLINEHDGRTNGRTRRAKGEKR
jgi:BlaI family transcriptional regulator, penicillinase repressor